MKKNKVNRENLKKVVRCYFVIDRKHHPALNDYLTKMYLCDIVSRRRLIERSTDPEIKIFAYWLGLSDPTNPTNPTAAQTAKQFNTTAPKVQNINAKFINLLIDEVLKDVECGLISEKPYFETKSERRKRETAQLHEYGLKRPPALNLPKEIRRQFRELGLKPPTAPKVKTTINDKARLFMWLDECKFEVEKYYFTLKNKDLTQRAQKTKELIETIEKKMNFTNLLENE